MNIKYKIFGIVLAIVSIGVSFFLFVCQFSGTYFSIHYTVTDNEFPYKLEEIIKKNYSENKSIFYANAINGKFGQVHETDMYNHTQLFAEEEEYYYCRFFLPKSKVWALFGCAKNENGSFDVKLLWLESLLHDSFYSWDHPKEASVSASDVYEFESDFFKKNGLLYKSDGSERLAAQMDFWRKFDVYFFALFILLWITVWVNQMSHLRTTTSPTELTNKKSYPESIKNNVRERLILCMIGGGMIATSVLFVLIIGALAIYSDGDVEYAVEGNCDSKTIIAATTKNFHKNTRAISQINRIWGTYIPTSAEEMLQKKSEKTGGNDNALCGLYYLPSSRCWVGFRYFIQEDGSINNINIIRLYKNGYSPETIVMTEPLINRFSDRYVEYCLHEFERNFSEDSGVALSYMHGVFVHDIHLFALSIQSKSRYYFWWLMMLWFSLWVATTGVVKNQCKTTIRDKEL